MKKVVSSLVFCSLGFIGGCANGIHPGGATPSGLLIASATTTAPALAVTIDPEAKAEKVGEASSGAVFGLFAFGDSSVTAAMAEGRISRIHHVDYNNKSFLGGLFLGTTTIVYGE
jgi:Zn-dependent alcohol dehydrogenase